MTDDTNTIDPMTQEALNILMRTSPQHARHLEIVLENQLNGKAAEDLQEASEALGCFAYTARNSDSRQALMRLSKNLLSYASNLSLDS
jgi:hypothetical protein